MSRILNSCNDQEIDSNVNHIKCTWEELGYDESLISKKWQEITAEVLVVLRDKIHTIKSREDHVLRKHRIEKVRAEIIEWWVKCRYSDEEKAEFQAFSLEIYTDELLRLHQNELETLKKYHQVNTTLFELVDQYLALNERHLFLEAQDKNPNRLFENRGGQLLKDERDRKTTRKELPKKEKKITQLIEDFEKTYGRRFMIKGRTFEETLQNHTVQCSQTIDPANIQNVSEVKARTASVMKRKLPTASGIAVSGRSKSVRKAPLSPINGHGKNSKLSKHDLRSGTCK